MAEISGADVDEATAERVLAFLNGASTAADIAGSEPQDGPIRDDPSTGYGDQVRDYDIGLLVAQRILDKRATLGPNGFTDLAQLSNISGFGQDKFNDLVYSHGPAFYGEWETKAQSPVAVVHAALLRTGKVLMFAGTAEVNLPLASAVWDPEANGGAGSYSEQTGDELYEHDLFCSHHSFLDNGKLLVNGGAIPGQGNGIDATYLFDPADERWSQVQDMSHPRWYPTTVSLPDPPEAITFSGRDASGGVVPQIESYDRTADTWTVLPDTFKTTTIATVATICAIVTILLFALFGILAGIISLLVCTVIVIVTVIVTRTTPNKGLEIYPGMHLLPDGRVFYTGTRWDSGRGLWSNPEATAALDRNSRTWADVSNHVVRDRTEGMSVILPPDNMRVLVIGGRGDDRGNSIVSTDTVEMIDFNDQAPQWRLVQSMHTKRRNVNAVLLPTGNVLVCAGIEGFKAGNPATDAVLTAEEYDPAADAWTELAEMETARLYHSVSLLLPDARVVNLGSIIGDGNFNLTSEVEVYSPPYIFKGPPPEIADPFPDDISYGETFEVLSPQAEAIGSIVLVRPGASTHHTDSEQRIVPLAFRPTVDEILAVTTPGGTNARNLAVPGYYMLFIVTREGVPSHARFVRLS